MIFTHRDIFPDRGGHPVFFVKLDFEIAVDQQTKAHDQTFEEVPDSGCPRDSHVLIWSIFDSILPNRLNMLKTVFWGNILGRVMSKILYAHIWAYATSIIDFGP